MKTLKQISDDYVAMIELIQRELPSRTLEDVHDRVMLYQTAERIMNEAMDRIRMFLPQFSVLPQPVRATEHLANVIPLDTEKHAQWHSRRQGWPSE